MAPVKSPLPRPLPECFLGQRPLSIDLLWSSRRSISTTVCLGVSLRKWLAIFLGLGVAHERLRDYVERDRLLLVSRLRLARS